MTTEVKSKIVWCNVASAIDYTADPNCQGAWFMNGATSANELDRSGNANTLTVHGGTPSSTTVPTGYSGKSRSFDGASEYFSRAEADLVGLDINGADCKLSIVVWIRVTLVPALGGVVGIVSKHDAPGNQRQYIVEVVGTGSSQFKIASYLSKDSTTGGTPSLETDSTTTTYAANTWYHIALVYNDVDVRIYVNGVLDCTPNAKTNGIYNGTADFLIGSTVASQYFAGQIDEVAVFDRELSATEVLDIYTNGISGNKGGSD